MTHSNNINVKKVGKIGEGHTELLELMKKGKIQLVINTPSGRKGQSDARHMRNLATMQGIPCITTIQGAQAAVNGMESLRESDFSVTSIQEYLEKYS